MALVDFKYRHQILSFHCGILKNEWMYFKPMNFMTFCDDITVVRTILLVHFIVMRLSWKTSPIVSPTWHRRIQFTVASIQWDPRLAPASCLSPRVVRQMLLRLAAFAAAAVYKPCAPWLLPHLHWFHGLLTAWTYCNHGILASQSTLIEVRFVTSSSTLESCANGSLNA